MKCVQPSTLSRCKKNDRMGNAEHKRLNHQRRGVRKSSHQSRHPTYGIHWGRTFQSRHPTSTPLEEKPNIPQMVYHQPISVREEAPTKSLHPLYQEKHSSSTQAQSKDMKTVRSRSWRAESETSRDKNVDT